MKTKQEIFNAVWQYFIVEKNPQSSDGDTCLYRSSNGDGTFNKCAIGCMLPDELYNPKMEHMQITIVFTYFIEVAQFFGTDNLLLLTLLQGDHDYFGDDIVRFESHLRMTAAAYELTIPQ